MVHFLVVACCIFGDIQFDLCHHLIYLTGLKEARFSLDAIAWNPINKQHTTHLFPTFRSFFLHHHHPLFLCCTLFIDSTMQLSKAFLLSAVLVLALIQTAYASVYSQLHFMKVIEPKDGQDIRAGEKLKVKYSMQPLIDGKCH